MKGHQIAEIVNALRDAAVTHHASGQLRERLRGCIEPLLLAIAPPVAAGSVDTAEFQKLMHWFRTACFDPYSNVETKAVQQTRAAIIAHIDAWGVHQREAALAEQLAVFKKAGDSDQVEFNRKWTEQKERAEKAEAELESWVHTNRIDELQRGYNAALARVKELEAQLSRRRATLSPEVRQAIADARAAGQTIAATSGGLVFLNDGTGPGEGELDCQACGGSGHAGDAVAGSAA